LSIEKQQQVLVNKHPNMLSAMSNIRLTLLYLEKLKHQNLDCKARLTWAAFVDMSYEPGLEAMTKSTTVCPKNWHRIVKYHCDTRLNTDTST
jgi:hypothetical protein